MNKPYLNTSTPRLTDQNPDRRGPGLCQLCGWPGRVALEPGKPGLRADLDNLLQRWQECDHHDRPEQKVIVLCPKCAARVIEPHPRLYRRLPANQPWPGCMDLCRACKFRDGVACTHPHAKANGGAGVSIDVAVPLHALVDGPKYSGPVVIWPEAPTRCHEFDIVF